MKSIAELEKKGIEFELVRLSKSVHTAQDVQISCGCKISEVMKTLVLVGSRPIVIILPGDRRASVVMIKRITGVTDLRMAKPSEVLALTTYSVGTVSPFGINPTIEQIADASVTSLPFLYFGSGKDDILIKISKSEFAKSFRGSFFYISDK